MAAFVWLKKKQYICKFINYTRYMLCFQPIPGMAPNPSRLRYSTLKKTVWAKTQMGKKTPSAKKTIWQKPQKPKNPKKPLGRLGFENPNVFSRESLCPFEWNPWRQALSEDARDFSKSRDAFPRKRGGKQPVGRSCL
ncbi:MAG: hypothetical protein LBF40_10670 [Deltaproteobacteria bacterium]|nr:hypothetical protein [Deltaproteobacteria bacterium]